MNIDAFRLCCVLALVPSCFNPTQPAASSAGTEGSETTDGTGGSTAVLTDGTSPTGLASTGGIGTTSSTDHGSTAGDSQAEGSSTSSDAGGSEGGALCGNGELDAGEACDDANQEDGDGCNNDCVESGTLIWEVEPAEGFEIDDEGHQARRQRLAVNEDGRVAFAVSTRATDGTTTPVVGVLDADGSSIWLDEWLTPDLNRVSLEVGLSDDDSVLLSTAEAPVLGGNSTVVRRYNAGGSPQWDLTYDQDDYVIGGGVDADGDGGFLVAGYFGGEADLSWMLSRLSPAGREVLALDGVEVTTMYAHGVRHTGDGGFIVCAGRPPDYGNDDVGRVTRYAEDGSFEWTTSVPDVGMIQCDADDAGTVALVGDLAGTSWLGQLDGKGELEWSVEFEGIGTASLSSVVIDSHQRVISGGTLVEPSASGDNEIRWVRKFDADGSLLWELQLDFSESEDESISDVGVDGTDDIYVIGRRDVVGDDNAWIAKLAP